RFGLADSHSSGRRSAARDLRWNRCRGEAGAKSNPRRGWNVEDRVDDLAGGNFGLDGVEEAKKLLMAMALHVAADHGSIEPVHRREKGGRPVPLVIVGHGSGAALLHRQARLSTVERLDLALLVDGQDDGVGGRIDGEPDNGG